MRAFPCARLHYITDIIAKSDNFPSLSTALVYVNVYPQNLALVADKTALAQSEVVGIFEYRFLDVLSR